jgi:hypothetical protein
MEKKLKSQKKIAEGSEVVFTIKRNVCQLEKDTLRVIHRNFGTVIQ